MSVLVPCQNFKTFKEHGNICKALYNWLNGHFCNITKTFARHFACVWSMLFACLTRCEMKTWRKKIAVSYPAYCANHIFSPLNYFFKNTSQKSQTKETPAQAFLFSIKRKKVDLIINLFLSYEWHCMCKEDVYMPMYIKRNGLVILIMHCSFNNIILH